MLTALQSNSAEWCTHMLQSDWGCRFSTSLLLLPLQLQLQQAPSRHCFCLEWGLSCWVRSSAGQKQQQVLFQIGLPWLARTRYSKTTEFDISILHDTKAEQHTSSLRRLHSVQPACYQAGKKPAWTTTWLLLVNRRVDWQKPKCIVGSCVHRTSILQYLGCWI